MLTPPPSPVEWGGELEIVESVGWDKNRSIIEKNKILIPIIILRLILIITIILVKREIKKEMDKTPEKQVVCDPLVHYLLPDAPTHCPFWPTSPSLYSGDEILWHGTSLWVVWAGYLFLPSCSVAEHGNLKNPWLRLSTA